MVWIEELITIPLIGRKFSYYYWWVSEWMSERVSEIPTYLSGTWCDAISIKLTGWCISIIKSPNFGQEHGHLALNSQYYLRIAVEYGYIHIYIHRVIGRAEIERKKERGATRNRWDVRALIHPEFTQSSRVWTFPFFFCFFIWDSAFLFKRRLSLPTTTLRLSGEMVDTASPAMVPASESPPPLHNKAFDQVIRTPGRQPSPQPVHLSLGNGFPHRVLHDQSPGYVAPKFEGKEKQMEQGESTFKQDQWLTFSFMGALAEYLSLSQ